PGSLRSAGRRGDPPRRSSLSSGRSWSHLLCREIELDQLGSLADLLAYPAKDPGDPAPRGCPDGVLHLHRFEYQQRRVLLDRVAGRDEYRDDLSGHRGLEVARPRLERQLLTQRIVHFQDVVPPGQEHLDAAAQADHAALDRGILELRRQSAVLAPVVFDLPPSI